MSDSPDNNGDFEPEQRALCPDGACLGVLDDAGLCKLCGQQGTPAAVGTDPDAAAAEAVTAEVPAVAEGLAVHEPDPAAAPATAAAESAAESGDDFADRQLCNDPSCIGVLDASGCCKECGRQLSDPLPA